MEKLEIVGDNYIGKWTKERIACRGIVSDGDRILLICQPEPQKWMIPGGGLEEGESDRDCCIREMAEETGVLVEPSDCLLEIAEYYGEEKFVNRYFLCKPVGTTEMHLTESEKRLALEPRWISVSEAETIFSRYDLYADTDEELCGVYLREYQALSHLLKCEI